MSSLRSSHWANGARGHRSQPHHCGHHYGHHGHHHGHHGHHHGPVVGPVGPEGIDHGLTKTWIWSSWSSLCSSCSSSWSSWSSSRSSRWASGARRHRSRPHQDLDHHSTFPLHHSPSSQRAHASNIPRMEYVFCPQANLYEQNFNHHPLALATYSPHSSWQTACAYYAADCIFFGLALDVL